MCVPRHTSACLLRALKVQGGPCDGCKEESFPGKFCALKAENLLHQSEKSWL